MLLIYKYYDHLPEPKQTIITYLVKFLMIGLLIENIYDRIMLFSIYVMPEVISYQLELR